MKTNYPKFIIILFFLAQLLPAQNDVQTDSALFKETGFLTHSLQFGISQSFTLSHFQGGIISYKYQKSPQVAFRIGLGVQFKDNKSDVDETRTGIDSSWYDDESTGNSININLNSQFLYYLNPGKKIKFYIGSGPYIAYRKSTLDLLRKLDGSSDYTKQDKRTDQKLYYLGLSTAYGVEWFFQDQMSLTAEYGFLLSYFHDERHSDTDYMLTDGTMDYRKTSRSGSGWELGWSDVKFGVSLYF